MVVELASSIIHRGGVPEKPTVLRIPPDKRVSFLALSSSEGIGPRRGSITFVSGKDTTSRLDASYGVIEEIDAGNIPLTREFGGIAAGSSVSIDGKLEGEWAALEAVGED